MPKVSKVPKMAKMRGSLEVTYFVNARVSLKGETPEAFSPLILGTLGILGNLDIREGRGR